MAIYITGDTHGGLNEKKLYSKNFPNYKDCKKEDYLIILGDWGYLYDYNPTEIEDDDEFKAVDNLHLREKLVCERNKMNATFSSRKFTTLVIMGNHDNYDRIKNFPVINMFGGKVRKIKDDIFELMRGEIYEINGYKFFVFGGAKSVDKYSGCRQEHISWWKEEECTYLEEYTAIENLKRVGDKVDFILSHTCSKSTLDELSKMYNFYIEDYDNQNRFFEEIKNNIDYDFWLFGHMHKDLRVNKKETVVFDKVWNIEDLFKPENPATFERFTFAKNKI